MNKFPRIACGTKRLESSALAENEQKRSLMLSAGTLNRARATLYNRLCGGYLFISCKTLNPPFLRLFLGKDCRPEGAGIACILVGVDWSSEDIRKKLSKILRFAESTRKIHVQVLIS